MSGPALEDSVFGKDHTKKKSRLGAGFFLNRWFDYFTYQAALVASIAQMF